MSNASLRKLHSFADKTLKAGKKSYELLTWSRCCKLNTFAPFLLVRGGKKPAIFPQDVCAHQFSFLSVYTAWRETHLPLKYLRGEWKDGRDARMQRPLLFSGPRKEKHWHRRRGKMWHFWRCDTSHLQIDALSPTDRRRCNECTSAAQRRATGILWDHSSGCFLTGFFGGFKAWRTSCWCYANVEGLEKMCIQLL